MIDTGISQRDYVGIGLPVALQIEFAASVKGYPVGRQRTSAETGRDGSCCCKCYRSRYEGDADIVVGALAVGLPVE